jgi:alpha-tubulin suppressor-like RCC1 family protein
MSQTDNNIAFLNTIQKNNAPYIKKFITQGGLSQVGIISNDNKMYHAMNTDNFPAGGLSGEGSVAGYPFFSVSFIKPDGTPETGTLIDAAVNSQSACALFDNGNFYTGGYNVNANCVLGDLITKTKMTLSATNVKRFFYPKAQNNNIVYSSLCIIKEDGILYFGGYDNGQSGLGNTVNTKITTWTPITYFPADTIKNLWIIGCTNAAIIVQKTDLTIHVSGANTSGSLGTGNTTKRTTFIDVTTAWGGIEAGEIINVSGATVSHDNYTLSQYGILVMHRRTEDGVDSVYTCGHNGFGQIGNGVIGGNITTPYKLGSTVATSFPTSIKKIATFGGSPLTIKVLANNGDTWSHGFGLYGQNGDGLNSDRSTPIIVQTDVDDIYCDGVGGNVLNYRSTHFIKKRNGQIKSVGYGINGQKGDGTKTNTNVYNPVMFNKDVNIVDIIIMNRTGVFYTLFLTDKGQPYGCGDNSLGGIDYSVNTQFFITPRPIDINFSL